MANCALCGKTIGFMDTITREIPNEDKGVCTKCHRIFVDSINKRIEGVSSIEDYKKEVSAIVNEFRPKYPSQAMDYLKDYLRYKENLVCEEISKLKEESLRNTEKEILVSKMNTHMLTTGYNFEGYVIKKYIDVISGETVLGTGFLSELFASASDALGEESEVFSQKMKKAKQSATNKLIKRSIAIGANAIIGVDFDYINFSNNMIGVSSNGTAVVIEKIAEE